MATSRLFHGQCFCIFNPLVTRHFLISRQYYAVALKNDCWKGRFWKNRERPSRLIRTWFSDKPPDQPHSVSIVITRGPLQWISNKIKLFLVNSYFDADFDEEIFIEGAKQAIITVSALVSERKFNELQGLVTSEAIENLKNELILVNNIESYLITMDDILQTNIHDIGFEYDETEKGKKWLHIMVSYILQAKNVDQEGLANTTFARIPRITRYSFRKECTHGVEDGWIITQVINFKQDTDV